jgi:hypothetical protein
VGPDHVGPGHTHRHGGEFSNLIDEIDRQRDAHQDPDKVLGALEERLRREFGAERNPWNPSEPAFVYTINTIKGEDAAGLRRMAEHAPAHVGQVVFRIEWPEPGRPGLLAGKVKTQDVVDHATIHVQIQAFE